MRSVEVRLLSEYHEEHGVVGLVFSTRFQSHITCNRFKSRMPKRRFQCSSVIEKQSKMSAAEGFVQFLRNTPTQFHVVRECVKQLTAAGFTRISEKESWEGKVKPSGRYFFTRNETSLFAFAVGDNYKKGDGFAIVAAHTDSPSLKLKPISKQESKGHMMLGVETYGGGKFYTWADRDLAVAGRLIVGGAFLCLCVVREGWQHQHEDVRHPQEPVLHPLPRYSSFRREGARRQQGGVQQGDAAAPHLRHVLRC